MYIWVIFKNHIRSFSGEYILSNLPEHELYYYCLTGHIYTVVIYGAKRFKHTLMSPLSFPRNMPQLPPEKLYI